MRSEGLGTLRKTRRASTSSRGKCSSDSLIGLGLCVRCRVATPVNITRLLTLINSDVRRSSESNQDHNCLMFSCGQSQPRPVPIFLCLPNPHSTCEAFRRSGAPGEEAETADLSLAGFP